ncbi:hypothetical protein P7C71_g4442, partial [Lecanoromycetidae sp. Uapishka_2]
MAEDIPTITNTTLYHHAQLCKPMLSYDAAAIALSFVPTAGGDPPSKAISEQDVYTYHHLRRDLYDLTSSTGVEIASRYTVPSSHLTIARFITQEDITELDGNGIDSARVAGLVTSLEKINAKLESDHWPNGIGDWIVGEEKGLDCRKGRLWYGGGQTVLLGNGL